MSAKKPARITTALCQSLVVAIVVLFAGSCGLLIQDSVTFHGTQCSDSRVWLGGDIVVAGGILYGVSSEGGEAAEALIPVTGLLLSAAAGYYKRGNCIAHQRSASPEEWDRDAKRARRQDEARSRAMQEALREQSRSQAAQPAQHSTTHKKYKKKVKFECNGSVLIDETFHSFEACDAFRRDNQFECSGMRIPINC